MDKREMLANGLVHSGPVGFSPVGSGPGCPGCIELFPTLLLYMNDGYSPLENPVQFAELTGLFSDKQEGESIS